MIQLLKISNHPPPLFVSFLSFTSMDSSYGFFGDLKAGRLHQRIVGRLLRFWSARNVKKGGQLMGVDFLLIDEKSTVMQGSINVLNLPIFEKKLRDGVIYMISGFDVSRSNSRFKLSDFQFSIRFTPNTSFDVLEESFCVIPKEHFRFCTHDQLVSLGNTNMELPDVMGQICSTKVYRNGVTQSLERMLIYLRLQSGEKVRVSAFDDHAKTLEEIFSKKDAETYIMLATNVNPKIFAGELYLNATSGTKFYFDDDFATTRDFVERLKGSQKEGTNSIQPYHGVHKIEHVSIEELNQFAATGNPQEAEFLCTATVTDIQSHRGWSFISCAACGTKMVKKESSLTCNNYKCKSTKSIGDVKYRVELVVNDGITSSVFVAFDKDMVKLTNIQASNLASQMVCGNQNSENGGSIPTILSDIVGKKLTFQIKLTDFNFTSHHQSFTVARIFDTPEAAPTPTFRQEVPDNVESVVQSPSKIQTSEAFKNTTAALEISTKINATCSGEDLAATTTSTVDNIKKKKQKCN